MDEREFLGAMARGGRVEGGSAAHERMHALSARARRILSALNRGGSAKRTARLFFRMTGQKPPRAFTLFPPFYSDCGINIRVGEGVFINEGCCFQDQGGIVIGDGVLIGQQVVIATLNHDLDPARRADMFPRPVRIGDRAWIGAHATILPGVCIGAGAVVAAGAVVTRDVPENTVVAGVPARTIRKITEGKER